MNHVTRELNAAGIKLPLAGFVLDLGVEQLRDSQGQAVGLRAQAWAVLRYLALNAGRLADKKELLDTVWPGLVVTDGSLTTGSACTPPCAARRMTAERWNNCIAASPARRWPRT